MRKICTIFPVALLLSCLWISGCNTKEDKQEHINEDYPQGGFINYTGSQMISTPEGFYTFKGSFLYYITPDLKKSTIVCGKPDCMHDKKNSEELTDFLGCDAYFADPKIGYYDKHLYIACDDMGTTEDKDVIYQVSMDGSERTLFYESTQFIDGFCIYGDYIYTAERNYQTSGVTKLVKRVSLNDAKAVETLFETDKYSGAHINRLDCYGDFCYFYLFGTEGDTGVQYYGINLRTGETKLLYESHNFTVFLYMNDYGTLIEDQELINDENLTWKSTYYHMEPNDTKLLKLTDKDFSEIADMATLKNMDDEYIYFCTPMYGESKNSVKEHSIYVYTYDGKIAAEIPVDKFQDMLFFLLPGTDDYMFLQVMTPQEGKGSTVYEYYYAEKSEFNGGEVTLKKLL